MSRTRRRTGLAVLALLMLATGCVSMPDSGPVHNADSAADASEAEASAIDAVPPAPGAPAADIVNGFINAMSAWPIEIGVARQYLSQEAAAAWNPDQGTITFAAALPPQVSGNVATVDLQQAEHLDASGAWLGDLPDDEQQLTFHLTSEDGEFRIADPRDALIVRDSWFAQRFIQVSLYFFDRTGRILVPEPVFVPRGGQLASTLTNRLLEPGEDLQGISRTYLPTVDAGLSVPVSDQGIAQIDLGGSNSAQPNDDDLTRMLAQLGWTLRQVPGIRALRVSIGGEELRPPGGDNQYAVSEGSQYDPSGSGANTLLYGLRDGLMVYGEPESIDPADGPFGEVARGLRSISVNLDASTAVGVSADGTSLLSAPVRSQSGERPVRIARNKTDLLPPSWDFADRLWAVDNSSTGARVMYRDNDGLRFESIDVPGVSRRRVRSFLISRDGTRFVAVVRGRDGDEIRAGRIQYDGQGVVIGAGATRLIPLEGVEGAHITDIAWTSPTSIIVVRPISGVTSEVSTVPVDGAPAESLSTSVSGRAIGLAASPDGTSTPFAVTRDGLVDLDSGATVPFIGGPVTSLGYVG